ncbi:MAG: hypothetical protein EOO78_35620 [Oxalobacteraceae bacterium]|nr:MAG: hypothetical protein EOO78_35620 [Oxalobacteraceae bacterium]
MMVILDQASSPIAAPTTISPARHRRRGGAAQAKPRVTTLVLLWFAAKSNGLFVTVLEIANVRRFTAPTVSLASAVRSA